MLFGAVEMSLTSLVAGFMSGDDPESLAKARGQLADVFLRGVLRPEVLAAGGALTSRET